MPNPVHLVVSDDTRAGAFREITDSDQGNLAGSLGATLSSLASPGAGFAKVFVFAAPAISDVVSVHAGQGASGANVFNPAPTSPVVPRNLQVLFNTGWDGGDLTVVGTDQFDNSITEVFTAGSGVTRVGSKVFKTTVSATKATVGASGVTATIGAGSKLGISGHLTGSAAAVLFADNGSIPGTLDATNNSVLPSVIPDGVTYFALIANVSS